MGGNNSRLTQGRAGKQEGGGGVRWISWDWGMLHFSSWNFFIPALANSAATNMWAVWKNKPWHFVFWPHFCCCVDCHSEKRSLYRKIMISRWERGHRKLTGTREHKKTRPTKDFIIPKSSYLPRSKAICHQQQVCIWEIKVQAAVLYSINFFDQWLLKGHPQPTETLESMGKCLARFTHTLPSFLLQTMNPVENFIQSKRVRLSGEDLSLPYAAEGWRLTAWVSRLPRLEASHTICFSHQRERVYPWPLICFSHDLHLWVLLSVFLMDTKRFYTAVFFGWLYVILWATGNTKHLPDPLGITPHTLTQTFGNDPAASVEDNEWSCVLD